MAISYESFDISIHRDGDRFEVRVLEPPSVPPVVAPLKLPWSIEEIRELLGSVAAQVGARAGRDLRPVGKSASAASSVALEQLGAELYDLLLTGKVRDAFKESLGRLGRVDENGNEHYLRCRLHFDRHEDLGPLAALPWELLHDGREYPFRRRRAPLVRYLGGCTAPDRLELDGPLRLLIVESSPIGFDPIDTTQERDAIEATSAGEEMLIVDRFTGHDLLALRHKLLDGCYHALHFIGHGGLAEGGDDQYDGLLYFTRTDGSAEAVTGQLLAECCKDTCVRLVVLNACYTGSSSLRQNPFTGVAAALCEHVPAVVAMQCEISDEAAITFARTFYKQLAMNDPIDIAVSEGRTAIFLSQLDTFEWATPVLFLSTKDSQLVSTRRGHTTMTHTQQTTEQGSAPQQEADRNAPDHLGIRSFSGLGSWGELGKHTPDELDLTDLFDDRFIRDDQLWDSQVVPRLRTFLLGRASRGGRRLVLDFAAHASIAFTAGYLLEIKSGLDVTIVQRGQHGTTEYHPEPGPAITGKPWIEEDEVVLDSRATDVAVALSVTHEIQQEVAQYLGDSGLAISRLVPLTVSPKAGQDAIRDGRHAMCLAQWLVRKVRRRSAQERAGTLHLFWSAPNALLFFLGQLSCSFGKIQLYENDFKGERWPLPYQPSITLPPR